MSKALQEAEREALVQLSYFAFDRDSQLYPGGPRYQASPSVRRAYDNLLDALAAEQGQPTREDFRDAVIALLNQHGCKSEAGDKARALLARCEGGKP